MKSTASRSTSKSTSAQAASKSKGGQRRTSKGRKGTKSDGGAPAITQERAPTVRSGVKAGGIKPNHNQRLARA